MRFLVKKVTVQEFAGIEAQFRDSLVDPGALQEAWKSLHEFFASNQGADNEYQWTYFRIYTELTWSLLSLVDRGVVIDVAFKRQVPQALRQGVDVWQKLMWYLSLNTLDKADTEKVYTDIQQSFFGSTAWINEVNGKAVGLDSIIEDVKKINLPNISSLESAELMARIKDVLVIKNIPDSETKMVASSDEVYDRLVGLVNFFLGVPPQAIYQIVDSFVNPEKYQPREARGTSDVVSEQNETTETVEGAAETEPAVSYLDLKNMIEARFTRDASGEFVNLDGVLAFLETMATEQGDEAIRDLYYYDEGVGKFQWNEALLT